MEGEAVRVLERIAVALEDASASQREHVERQKAEGVSYAARWAAWEVRSQANDQVIQQMLDAIKELQAIHRAAKKED